MAFLRSFLISASLAGAAAFAPSGGQSHSRPLTAHSPQTCPAPATTDFPLQSSMLLSA